MKQSRQQTRDLLKGDEDKVLKDTWFEYSNGQPLPGKGRDFLIEAILDLMEKEGHITAEDDQFFKLSDLARELGVDPKVARDKYRRAVSRGTAPESLKTTGWVFHVKDREIVREVIKLKKEKK